MDKPFSYSFGFVAIQTDLLVTDLNNYQGVEKRVLKAAAVTMCWYSERLGD